jgi:hypothetical protein
VSAASQFWPDGTSDADTTKLLVKATASGFKFNGKTTNAFRGAFIGDKQVIGKNGFVTVRRGIVNSFSPQREKVSTKPDQLHSLPLLEPI